MKSPDVERRNKALSAACRLDYDAPMNIEPRDPKQRYWVQSTKRELEGKLGTTFSLSNGMLGIRGAHEECPDWGCPEVVITRDDGVLARANGETLFEPFTNRNIVGRTGRGDTTFAGYMARRLAYPPPPKPSSSPPPSFR